MLAFFKKEKSLKGTLPLSLLILLIVGIGSSFLFSASWYFANTLFGDPYYFLRKQLLQILLGCACFYAISKASPSQLCRWTPYALVTIIFLNFLPLVPGLGQGVRGAKRWVDLFGLSFQPSEMTRVVVVLYLARMFEKNRDRMNDLGSSILPPMLVVVLLSLVIVLQRDFSSALFLFFLSWLLFFLAGARLLHLVGILGVGSILGSLLVSIEPYRWERLLSWWGPEADPQRGGFQILAARRALQQGGFWGKGIGRGTVKLGGLPQAHSDFISGVVGEEAGFVGIVLLMGLFSLFLYRGLRLAKETSSLFLRYVALGVSLNFFCQILISMGVVGGVFPPTGVPIPFFSVGGSAVLSTFVAFGLLRSIERNIPQHPLDGGDK